MPPKNDLDEALHKLALKLVNAANDSEEMDEDHKTRVETLKVAGAFALGSKRANKSGDDDDEDSMSAIRQRLRAAESHPGGHA